MKKIIDVEYLKNGLRETAYFINDHSGILVGIGIPCAAATGFYLTGYDFYAAISATICGLDTLFLIDEKIEEDRFDYC